MKAVVLLSGGLDSTVCLKKAVDEGAQVLAVTFDYGQKASKRELSAARRICKKLNVEHEVIKLGWLGALGSSALVDARARVPQPGREADKASVQEAARTVWVPNRNGVFVNVAAAMAEARGFDTVIAGLNRDEAELFPDNSIPYLAAANQALRFSTLSGVRLESYTASFSKKRILQIAKEISAPLDLIWYCYLGGRKPCGQCQSCLNYQRAAER